MLNEEAIPILFAADTSILVEDYNLENFETIF
jgi:hypothetical protein